MDAFEQVVATLLQQSGYWVRSSFKVDLTKEEKREIGKPSLPRPEIDLLAYRAGDNRVRAVECKSYLDSGGVGISAFDGSNPAFAKRFKLFNDDNWRDIVERRLLTQLVESGMCAPGATVTWTLAAGKIATPTDREHLVTLFKDRGWELWDAEWIGEQLEAVAGGGYENDVVSIVAKLLRRPKVRARATRRPTPPEGDSRLSDATHVPSIEVVTYRFSRFCFKAEVIEALREHEAFRVVTPVGTFQMRKRDFYRDFAGVVKTRSYREDGIYHYPRVPVAAERYRITE